MKQRRAELARPIQICDAWMAARKEAPSDRKERSAYPHPAVAYRRLDPVGKTKKTLNALRGVIEQERQGTREKMKSAAGAAPDGGAADRTLSRCSVRCFSLDL